MGRITRKRILQSDIAAVIGLQGQDPLICGLQRASPLRKARGDMSGLFCLMNAQMGRLEPVLPKPQGKPRADDRRGPGGMIFINRNGLRWRDAPAGGAPPGRYTRD
jgi:hypothetical protein